MDPIDIFFLISFFGGIILGYLIYRKFYTSIEEIMSTTEIKKSRAMQYRAEHLTVSSLKNSIFFSIILSLGINIIALLIYSWAIETTDLPEISSYFFFYGGLFVVIAYPLGELYFLCEKENQAETPHHKVLRSIVRWLVAKVKGKTEAVFLFGVIFYLIPILILSFAIGFDLIFSIFIVCMIYPLIIITYFIAYAIFKLFSPFIFLHNAKNIRLFLGFASIGIIILFELGLLLLNPYFIVISLLSFLIILINGIVNDLKYRPIELTHIIDDYRRPFEWVHGSYLILGFGLLTFLTMHGFFIVPFQGIGLTLVPDIMRPITNIICMGISLLIPLFLLIIILTKSKSYSRALVVSLTYDSMKLNAAIKSQLIHDKTLIETIEKSVNQNYIRPEYTPKLYRLLQNEDVHVRRKAIILLRKITEDDRFKSVSVVPNLLEFLQTDKIWTVRLEAAESLTNMMKILPKVEVRKIYDFLAELKPDKNRYVRWGIIKLFNSIAFARDDTIDAVMGFLFKGLEDDEWSVRKGTVESFVQLIDDFPQFTTEILKKSLKLVTDEDIDIINELFTLIQKITSTEVNEENLQKLENQINEITGAEPKFEAKLLQEAIGKIKEATKAPKFVFKKSDLPRKK